MRAGLRASEAACVKVAHSLRVAVYARYSNERSREASIPDQIRICRDLAERHGWEVVLVYRDAAISGASAFRSGYEELIAAASAGKFDVVMAESLDRLSRDQADIASFYKALSFLDIQIWTVSEGRVDQMHVGLKGTMNALFLKDLAAKTHRGLRGRIEAGKAGGGLSYGYRVVRGLDDRGELLRGGRSIDPAESQVVQRIFELFAAGRSPIWIAKTLNTEGVPGPSGRAWQDTTLRGHAVRGTGILRNELYVGTLVWNRMRYVKDPGNGRRVSRMNDPEQWISKPVPELRIVDGAVWETVQRRLGAIREKSGANEPDRPRFWDKRRPKHLLTGKLFCGCCGGSLGNVGKDYLACTAARRQGVCANRTSIKRSTVEHLVTDGLQHRLMEPVMFREFAAAFAAESERHVSDAERGKDERRRALAQVRLKLDKLVDAVANGLRSTTLQDKLTALERQELELTRELDTVPSAPACITPDLAELYRAELTRLSNHHDPSVDGAELEIIRGLVDRVTVTPAVDAEGPTIELEGDIVAMIGLAQGARRGRAPKLSAADRVSFGCSVKVVAGTGFEPVTFRL